jgi:acetylornithine deacetylase
MDEEALRKKVAARIEGLREDAARVLADLIRFPSVSGSESGAVSCMAERMREAGFLPKIVPLDPSIRSHPEYTRSVVEPPFEGRGNLVTEFGGGRGGKSLILNAHLDVVPAGGFESGFDPKREDDTIIGRGACDDKGGVVAGYLALRGLAECGVVPAGTLSCHHVIDEETGGNGTLSLLAGGYTADAAIVGECTDNALYAANRGAVWFQLTTTGVSAHMGEMDRGISAIDTAMEAIGILRQYERYLADTFGDHPYFRSLESSPVRLCIGMIHAGVWPSMVPDSCEVVGGIGFLPNKDIREVEREMREWILDRGGSWLANHFDIRYDKLHNAAYEVPEDHPFVQAVRNAAPQAGVNPAVGGWNVSCDARLFGRVAGIPAVCAGPGQLRHAHSSCERVELGEIVKAAKLYAFTAMDWCGIE